MFSWPAVVRSCLFLLPTVLYMYVRTYLLFSIDIILTIFHELGTYYQCCVNCRVLISICKCPPAVVRFSVAMHIFILVH